MATELPPLRQTSINSVLVVLVAVMLGCFLRSLDGTHMMSVCQMSMMAGRFVGAGLVMLGSLPMMSGSVLVVFGRFLVMLCAFVLSHLVLSLRAYTVRNSAILCSGSFHFDYGTVKSSHCRGRGAIGTTQAGVIAAMLAR